MHEVIHLSLSSSSNHLNSHFYNAQESYFVYTDADLEKSKVDPSVRFQHGTGYTPRALIWDLRGGFGALKQYSGAYEDTTASSTSSTSWQHQQQTVTQRQIPTSDYQHSLDNGLPAKLTASNTLYWSDYLHVQYHPKSQLTLKDWEYDPEKFPKGRQRGVDSSSSANSFKGHDIGTNQWNQIQLENGQEYLDKSFRPILEQCDSLAGLSITTDVDSAWGGFTESMLAEIVDEYAPKIPRFVWGLYDQQSSNTNNRISIPDNLSRIKSTSGLIEYSTLFIPLSLPKEQLLPKKVAELFQSATKPSPWQITAVYNLVYEPVSVLSSLRNSNRISMSTLTDSLLQGDDKRNIVISQSATTTIPVIDFSTTLITPQSTTPTRPIHHFAKYGLLRQPPSSTNDNASNPISNYGIADLRSGQSPWDLLNTTATTPSTTTDLLDENFHQKQLLDEGTAQSHLHQLKQKDFAFAQPTSYPSSLINATDSVYTGLSITTAPSSALKSMADYISRFDRGSDDREQLKDSLTTLAEAYSWGYESDSEQSDD